MQSFCSFILFVGKLPSHLENQYADMRHLAMQNVDSVHLLFEIRFVDLDISYTFQLIFIRLLPQYIDPVLHSDIILFWYRDQCLLLVRRPSHIVIDLW